MKKVAYLFPGQGSQTVGMGKSFLEHPIAKDVFEQASDSLGFDLKKLCLEGPAEELMLTQNAQPSILTISTIAYRLFEAEGVLKPYCAAGHSLGEYSALVAAGVLTYSDAVLAVNLRGKYMQEAVPVGEGSMAAILGKSEEEVETLCREAALNEIVAPANFNTSGQIVIAGHTSAVKRVLEKAKGKLLAVSAPFHSQLMRPAAEKLEIHLAKLSFANADFPIVNNAENHFLSKADDFLPSLVQQVTAPVRWESGIRAMIAEGVTEMVEFGEGNVLTAMMKRIDKKIVLHSVSDMDSLRKTLEALS